MKTKNIIGEIEKIVAPFLIKLKKQDYVAGVVLLGGLGKRRFIDEFSDIDILVFIWKTHTLKFPLPFEFHYNQDGRFMEFNIHQKVLENEERTDFWDDFKIEAYSRGRIIYDPTGRIKKLIKKKTKFDAQKAFNRLIWIVQQYKWRGQIHSIRSCQRGYAEAAHDLLNQCSELLIEGIYLLNKRYLPHKKWSLVYLDEMRKPLNQLKNDFKSAMIIRAYTLSDIKRRLRILNKVYEIILAEISKKYKNFPSDPYVYYYKNFIQLNKQTKIDVLLNEFHKYINNKDFDKLKGLLCFNLIDTRAKLYKETSLNSDIKEYKNVIRKRDKYGSTKKN